MNLKFTGLNIDVTDALKSYATAKLERITRHVDNVISITMTLSVEKVNKKAEIDLHLSGKDLHVEATDPDMYAAIDGLMDKLDRAVLKHKEKKQQVRATPSGQIDVPAVEAE
ncbi:ribosome hibernation-promoting factor, HPF/YfiA family [Snodgrassella sp. CFCC 13594]|uniref:ribosome hibernation-promoting factor, HPF/YfiA family n=1 Tax=Snodgrassella sp. CFCC 13594 TaxID=1775559 RepID=UPI00082C1EB4|nr:ribosome-associated translation inhibitor RaiA [Snodgrassella sp. CFCC 13594]